MTAFLDELREVLRTLDPSLKVCLIGDFNVNILNASISNLSDYPNILVYFGIECRI